MLAAAIACSASVQAGVTLDIAVGVTSKGNDIYTVTATSDAGPITSVGVNVAGNRNIVPGPNPPCLNLLCMDQYGMIIGEYTKLLIDAPTLIIHGASDTPDLFAINATGFPPFQSQAFLQIVLTSGEAIATIGVVADGEEFMTIPYARGSNSVLVPEPASLMMLATASLVLIRRK